MALASDLENEVDCVAKRGAGGGGRWRIVPRPAKRREEQQSNKEPYSVWKLHRVRDSATRSRSKPVGGQRYAALFFSNSPSTRFKLYCSRAFESNIEPTALELTARVRVPHISHCYFVRCHATTALSRLSGFATESDACVEPVFLLFALLPPLPRDLLF